MRTPIIQATIPVLLFVAGGLIWRAAAQERRIADAQSSLAKLQYERAYEGIDASTDDAEAARARAAAGYWLGDAAAVRSASSGDAFVAANAAYRAAVREGGDWRAMTGKLDAVIKQYAGVLRDHAGHRDAAYNYEFVVRYRAAIATRQQAVPPEPDRPDLTVHGRAGAPPDTSELKKFKVIVPMRPEERREAEEAGQRGRRIRKG
ncbi:MAG TPA: hypothetical protein VHJ77_06360 [Vicinamibacterales bacterium]|jgi:hypothetical protein|nr:hypothetical protein [Vicinamibacterales bacterium]